MFQLSGPSACTSLRYETSDHKATRNDEAERIKTAGGRVVTTEYEDSFRLFFLGGKKQLPVVVVIFGWGWSVFLGGTLYFWLGLFFVLHGMCSAVFFSPERGIQKGCCEQAILPE